MWWVTCTHGTLMPLYEATITVAEAIYSTSFGLLDTAQPSYSTQRSRLAHQAPFDCSTVYTSAITTWSVAVLHQREPSQVLGPYIYKGQWVGLNIQLP